MGSPPTKITKREQEVLDFIRSKKYGASLEEVRELLGFGRQGTATVLWRMRRKGYLEEVSIGNSRRQVWRERKAGRGGEDAPRVRFKRSNHYDVSEGNTHSAWVADADCKALVCCPNGHMTGLGLFSVKDDGTVEPALACEVPRCGFEGRIQIDGWVPDRRTIRVPRETR